MAHGPLVGDAQLRKSRRGPDGHKPDAKREKEEGGWRLKVGTMWEFPLNSAGDYGRLQGSDFR